MPIASKRFASSLYAAPTILLIAGALSMSGCGLQAPSAASPQTTGSAETARAGEQAEFVIVGEDAATGTAEGPSKQAQKSVLDEYTWSELGAIAQEISAAQDKSEALQIASSYQLCAPDGTLDGTQLKSFELADGTQLQAQIVGFWHDDLSGGTGKAGISFITKDCVAARCMNEADTNAGGWEESDLRRWLNDELVEKLPEDLRSEIAPVDKLTNNVGTTEDPSSITATSDVLWVPSLAELVGEITYEEWLASALENGWYADETAAADAYERLERNAWPILSYEGEQYQLFSDVGIDIYAQSGNPIFVRCYEGYPVTWWERNPSPGWTNAFSTCRRAGTPDNCDLAPHVNGVAFGFCL